MMATAAAAALVCAMALLAPGSAAAAAPGLDADADVDVAWYPPADGPVNNLTSALVGRGVYGFIYNSSATPDGSYGTYNWCNMPHVRPDEYPWPPAEYELQYVELMQRHHKRTPYASNAFPVESYDWNCSDSRLFLYAEPGRGPEPSRVHGQRYSSPVNPFVPPGFGGTCSFPQITAEGLVDSWQHGADLYALYHSLVGLLPSSDDAAAFASAVRYRVTNNPITSQVAGMLISGMRHSADPMPLMVQHERVDSLEPQYSCPAASRLFRNIKSDDNEPWRRHLESSTGLYRILDDISQVPPNDTGFHASFDHYYDNLSARQCHGKPLPCKLVDGSNSSTCVTQDLADAVYRMGNWEYSQIYRDHPSSLLASAASLGVWVAELAAHLRGFMDGHTDIVYFHNIAHDGSVSRLLSILQIDRMVWPGMGSEVVFELYKRRGTQQPDPRPTPTPTAPGQVQDGCLHHLLVQESASASSLCRMATQSAPALGGQPAWPCQCRAAESLASACSQLNGLPATTAPIATAAPVTEPPPNKGQYYVRVLFGGKVLKSSSPTLGTMSMVPVEAFLAYLDHLVGQGAAMVKEKCQG